MTDQQVLPPETTGTALMTMDNFNHVTVVSDGERLDAFFAHVKAECDAFVPDLTTPKGRAEIASMAFKVTKTKTAIDKAGLELTEEWRKNTAKVNAARKDSKERFEALADSVRAPLTEWETAEANRVKAVTNFFVQISLMTKIDVADTSASISRRIEELSMMMEDVVPSAFLEREAEARSTIKRGCDDLEIELKRVLHAEADKAELERHRQAEADRLRAEAARIESEQEAQRLANEAHEREEAAQRARDAETARIAQVAETARLDAIAAEQRKHQEQLDAATREADAKLADANATIEAERQKAAQAERDRRAEADRIAAEKAKAELDEAEQKRIDALRQQNIEHRGNIMRLAKEALMADADIDEDTAKRVIKSIVGGMVPAVTIAF